MSKVKKISIGGKVRCINNFSCSAIKEGEIYTVSTVSESYFGNVIGLEELGTNSSNYTVDRFIPASEPWYVMAWDIHENQGAKVELVKDLTDDKAVKGPGVVVVEGGVITTFKYKSDIKSWRSRNVVYTNSYGEDIVKEGTVCFVRKGDLSILKVIASKYTRENCIESEVYTEAMSEERANTYVKEHKPEYVQFSDKEMYDLVGRTVYSSLGRYMITGCEESKGITWVQLGNVTKHRCHSGDLLNGYRFADTKEPVGKLNTKTNE